MFITGARIEKGKLILKFPKEYQAYINTREGKEVTLKIEDAKKQRTGQQNRYYWGAVLTTISDYTGHSTEELHEVFKSMFLVTHTINFKGKEVKITKSTTELDTISFIKYIDRIIAEVASMGIVIPSYETYTDGIA
jgi:hypothetical protein